MQLQSGLIRAGRCHKFWVKLKSTLDYFHPTTKSCFSPSSFRDLFSSISFTKPTLILLHQQQRRVHDSMRLKMFNAKLFSNTLTRDLILSRPSTKFLKNQTDIHTLGGWSPLGTDPKKIKYGFSEHGPISFDPPTSEGFSEQNYSETW